MKTDRAIDIHLAAGHFRFGHGPFRVHTLLGTCIAITMWHPRRHLGGICHYLLPTRPSIPQTDRPGPGMYADEAMGLFASALKKSKTHPAEYVVKIAGGGNMFPQRSKSGCAFDGACSDEVRNRCDSIGCKNIHAARTLLAAGGYAIEAEHVGGTGSRTIVFDLSNGEVWLKRGSAMSGGLQDVI